MTQRALEAFAVAVVMRQATHTSRRALRAGRRSSIVLHTSTVGDFASWYQNGGVFMHPIFLMGIVGAVVGVLALTSRKKPTIIFALTTGLAIVAVGAAGYFMGMSEVERALADAPPDQLEMARARGTEIAKVPLTWGMIWCVPALLGGALGLALGPRGSE